MTIVVTRAAASRAGFVDLDPAQGRKARLKALPDPPGQHLGRRILEPFDVIQIVVVQSLEDRFECRLDVTEIQDPSRPLVGLAPHVDPYPVGVAVQPPAFVTFGDVGQQVSRVEREFLPDLH